MDENVVPLKSTGVLALMSKELGSFHSSSENLVFIGMPHIYLTMAIFSLGATEAEAFLSVILLKCLTLPTKLPETAFS